MTQKTMQVQGLVWEWNHTESSFFKDGKLNSYLKNMQESRFYSIYISH